MAVVFVFSGEVKKVNLHGEDEIEKQKPFGPCAEGQVHMLQ